MIPQPTLDEVRSFAKRYGLEKLAPEHIERMTELASYVADLGRNLPRPRDKHTAPYANTSINTEQPK